MISVLAELCYNSDMVAGDEIIPQRTRINKKRQRLDIVNRCGAEAKQSVHALSDAQDHNVMTLISRGRRTAFFVTEDSGRYISQKQSSYLAKGYKVERGGNTFDSVHVRYIAPRDRRGELIDHLSQRYGSFLGSVVHMREMLFSHVSPFKVWNASLIGAILFGMISMTLIYRNLGQGVFADASSATLAATGGATPKVAVVLGATDDKEDAEEEVELEEEGEEDKKEEKEKEMKQEDVIVVEPKSEKEEKVELEDSIEEKSVLKDPLEEEKSSTKKEKPRSVDAVIVNNKSSQDSDKDESEDDDKGKKKDLPIVEGDFEAAVKEMVKGYPIEKMLPYLFQQDPTVAAYYIAIAKVESNWGKRVPVYKGQDCYNYLGYRGQRKLMGSGGHTCFNSRRDAVETISKRIDELVNEYDRKTPAQMVVWKCGSSCAGHGSSAQRWIDHVGGYLNELTKHL